MMDGSTHACKTEQCAGGVARNIAEALWRLRNGRTRLLTAIGDDDDGQYLQDIAENLILDGCIVKNARTAKYAAIFDVNGECKLGLGDMAVHDHISIDLVNKHIDVLKKSPLIVIDGNIPTTTIDYVLKLCKKYGKPVFFEPTDRRKAIKPLICNGHIEYASPNLVELKAMANFLSPNNTIKGNNELNEIIDLSRIVLQSVGFLLVTRGAKGVVTIKNIQNNNIRQLEVRVYNAEIINSIENASGAGDCFSSGLIHGILMELNESQCIKMGFKSAKEALVSKDTVPCMFNAINTFDEAECTVLTI